MFDLYLRADKLKRVCYRGDLAARWMRRGRWGSPKTWFQLNAEQNESKTEQRKVESMFQTP